METFVSIVKQNQYLLQVPINKQFSFSQLNKSYVKKVSPQYFTFVQTYNVATHILDLVNCTDEDLKNLQEKHRLQEKRLEDFSHHFNKKRFRSENLTEYAIRHSKSNKKI